MVPVFRFAPSPNGYLHLGHALSACLNYDRARQTGGRFLLRIENIDGIRCKPEFEQAIQCDLAWLGLVWETPVRRQSEHVATYRQQLDRLISMGLAYPAFLSRNDVRARVEAAERGGNHWKRDPDGTPHYPEEERTLSPTQTAALIESGARHMWRLNMDKAFALASRLVADQQTDLSWDEEGKGKCCLDPRIWGDIVLWRWDAPSSYHLSVVTDDALQGITHVIRGMDLFHATPVHRLLQTILELPVPSYFHHRLVSEDDGNKLSKSAASTGLRELRAAGYTPSDIRRMIDLPIL